MWGSYAQFLKFRVISTISRNLNLYMCLNDYMNDLHYIYGSYYTVFNINEVVIMIHIKDTRKLRYCYLIFEGWKNSTSQKSIF